jgi:hypothetical protein
MSSVQTPRFAGKPWWQLPSTGQPSVRVTESEPPAKGHYNGICHRFDCTNPGAHWYNPSTARYLCSRCARIFMDAQRKAGGPRTMELHLPK